MAKPETSKTPASTPQLVKPPEGMRRFNGDVVGFHDCESQGPLYGIPRAAKLSDNGQDPKKPSCFVILEALDAMKVTEGTGEDATEFMCKTGDMVGLWLKGGMRQIRNLCGVPVFIQYAGEKKLKGRPPSQSPMQLFDFNIGEGKGTPIPMIEDNRKQSREAPTMFDAPKGAPVKGKPREPGDDSEDQPYGF